MDAETPGTGDAPAIEARGLTRRFGKLVAVDHVDLTIPRARIYGFLGPNGSGKSTTIRMLCGLLEPSAGTVRVLGHEMPRDAEQMRAKLGYMTQRFSLWDDLTVHENLKFMARIFGLVGRGARRAHRRARGRVRSRAPAAAARRHAERRTAPAARARRGDAASPGAAAARRADERRRPQEPPGFLGEPVRAGRSRHHDPRVDPLHGRGRALSPSRHPRSRPPGGGGCAEGADGRHPGHRRRDRGGGRRLCARGAAAGRRGQEHRSARHAGCTRCSIHRRRMLRRACVGASKRPASMRRSRSCTRASRTCSSPRRDSGAMREPAAAVEA